MISSLLSSMVEIARPVSWTLFDSLWQGALVAAGLYLLLFFFRNKKPQVRYTLACLAMLTILALSINSFISYTGTGQLSVLAEKIDTSSRTEVDEAPVLTPEKDSRIHISTPLTLKIRDTLNPWLFFAWLSGVLFITVYHLTGWYRTRGLLTRGVEEFETGFQKRLGILIQKTGIKRPVRIVRSLVAGIPCVVGWIKPMVLVPVGVLSGLTEEELEMIIIHELAHIRRHDVLINYIQAVMETLFFFNPAVWLISRHIRLEREHCCDETAVKITGDKMKYAKALTNLEENRTVAAHLSPAARSGSLLERIRRITSATVPERKNGSIIINLVSIMILVGTVFAVQSILPDNVTAKVNLASTDKFEVQDNDIQGSWEIDDDRRDRQIKIEFRRRWSGRMSMTWNYDELDLKPGDDVYFKWEADAGTFFFEGYLEEEDGLLWGEGDCYFRASREFMDSMRDMGYTIKSEEKCLELAVHGITLDFAKEFENLGYDLSLDRLVEFKIHDVSPEFVKEMLDLGYKNLSEDRLVEMKIHGVSPDFVRELKTYGIEDLDASKLVEMRIHGVDPGYIKEFNELGYSENSTSKLVEMRIHGVSPGFVRELKDLGYNDLSTSKLVEMKIHGVDPYFITDLQKLGYKDISTSRLVEMRIHNVTPYYIEELAEVGYKELETSKLVEMRIHGVDKVFIKKLQDRGLDDLTPDELIEYKINGFNRASRRHRY